MIRITKRIIDRIVEQGRRENPLEACGYLAGNDNEVEAIFPMTNVDQSPEHYSFAPEEQFSVMQEAHSRGLELIAAYHTHPVTPAQMSAEDIRLAYDTGILYIIYSLKSGDIKAFKVSGKKQVTEVPVKILL